MDHEGEPKAQTDVVVTGSVGGDNKTLKLIILLASLGMIAFIVITLTFSFKEPIFNALFPKPASVAAPPSGPPAQKAGSQSSPTPSESTTPPPTSSPTSNFQPPTSSFEGAKRIFITSSLYDGNLGGLTGADNKCQTRADSLKLGGSWKAWVSDSKSAASSRLNHFGGPYKAMDGTVVADSWADLTDGALKVQINLNEYAVPISWNVWTNTKENGELASVDDCVGWTSNISYLGRVGSSSYSDLRWTSYSTSTCNYTRRLYCIEQ